MKKFLVVALVLALTSAAFAATSWDEQMTVDPDYSAAGPWLTGRGGAPLAVSGGTMSFDGFNLIDDRYNHPLNDDTNFEIQWARTPSIVTTGSGLWFNFCQDGVNGNSGSLNALLGRDSFGDARVIFEQQGLQSPILAEGPVNIVGSFVENTTSATELGVMAYVITDSVGTHTGSISVARNITPNSQPAGITVLGWYSGAVDGEIDYFTVDNIPEPITFALLSLGGLFLRRRK